MTALCLRRDSGEGNETKTKNLVDTIGTMYSEFYDVMKKNTAIDSRTVKELLLDNNNCTNTKQENYNIQFHDFNSN